MLSKEELLKPRYKVIADYPDSHYELGSVLDRDWARYPEDDETKPAIWRISQFPHLFKKMSWWEEREESDMPESISFISLTLKEKYGDDENKNRKYLKVTSWNKNEKGEWCYNDNSISSLGKSFLPATREEYEQYQQSK